MSFLDDDFLLQGDWARRLYHDYAKSEPICDYHCHLSPQALAENRPFSNLAALWLAGDHYKWRAMRANGIEERWITGQSDPYEKFLAFCRTVPHTLRNPLYHWCHLELKRYFGLELPINEETGPEIWEEANRQLKEPSFLPREILKRFQVRLVGTTDDPVEDLEHHQALAQEGLDLKVIPTFRPDRGMQVDQPGAFTEWASHLASRTGSKVPHFPDFLRALKLRHDAFAEHGARASDHGFETCPYAEATEAELERIYQQALSGIGVSSREREQFSTAVLREVGRWNAERNWVMQFHLGPMRNTNSRSFDRLGSDAGFDSMGDFPQAKSLVCFLDSLDRERSLPKVILYNLNPRDNYLFATLAGNFQEGPTPGKIQFGSGWWFLDQKEGIEWQLNALSNCGLLSRFVGMLTDSRSFMSFPRHEYFRRVLCNLLGSDMEAGLLPEDAELIGDLVRRICYRNAEQYFFPEHFD